jgi:hypothetical protein
LEIGHLIGCAFLIAVVAFLFGLIVSLFGADATMGERLLMAVMVAGMAFVAALLLLWRDRARHKAAVKSVRKRLLERKDIGDAEYLAAFQGADVTLIAQTRRAVADFFDVPVQKIHPTDNLRQDFKFAVFEPGFHSFVLVHVFKARGVQPKPFGFRTSHLATIGDLANEIQRVLDGFESGHVDNEIE